MTLVDWEINDAKRRGEIDITPYDTANLQQVSYDVHLGSEVKIRLSWFGRLWHKLRGDEVKNGFLVIYLHKCRKYKLRKGSFALAHTNERIRLDDCHCSFLHGVSTVARNALSIHEAGLIDNGFPGQITLELTANWDVEISILMRIGQLEFRRTAKPTRSYSETGRYMNQLGATEARGERV